ncbi:B12-binding domain-containing protein [Phycisphaerales bacterium AB-hyl4]|uniref:B12-binding domain-containing protein n=1 Tax=Natronomicrosphaera hydrolytica TaxID=3242702 RepID=A0ABV4U7X7_9BACT
MASRRNVIHEQFFNALISGDRDAARSVVNEALDADIQASQILTHLFWPTLEHVQNLHRNDQLSDLAYQFATRLLRQLVDQMQMRLESGQSRDCTVLVACGAEQAEELAAQMAADLLEADGYTVFYAGGGIANDELVEQLGQMKANKLVIFGAVPQTVPYTRLLIDRLHELGVCPDLQIIVGGGVFNRAEGLAEEIGADLWANDPGELVQTMAENPDRRMGEDQRTVGRRRRQGKSQAA